MSDKKTSRWVPEKCSFRDILLKELIRSRPRPKFELLSWETSDEALYEHNRELFEYWRTHLTPLWDPRHGVIQKRCCLGRRVFASTMCAPLDAVPQRSMAWPAIKRVTIEKFKEMQSNCGRPDNKCEENDQLAARNQYQLLFFFMGIEINGVHLVEGHISRDRIDLSWLEQFQIDFNTGKIPFVFDVQSICPGNVSIQGDVLFQDKDGNVQSFARCLIQRGIGRVFSFNPYLSLLIREQTKAEKARVGVWGIFRHKRIHVDLISVFANTCTTFKLRAKEACGEWNLDQYEEFNFSLKDVLANCTAAFRCPLQALRLLNDVRFSPQLEVEITGYRGGMHSLKEASMDPQDMSQYTGALYYKDGEKLRCWNTRLASLWEDISNNKQITDELKTLHETSGACHRFNFFMCYPNRRILSPEEIKTVRATAEQYLQEYPGSEDHKVMSHILVERKFYPGYDPSTYPSDVKTKDLNELCEKIQEIMSVSCEDEGIDGEVYYGPSVPVILPCVEYSPFECMAQRSYQLYTATLLERYKLILRGGSYDDCFMLNEADDRRFNVNSFKWNRNITVISLFRQSKFTAVLHGIQFRKFERSVTELEGESKAAQRVVPAAGTAETGRDVVPAAGTAETGQGVVPAAGTAETGQGVVPAAQPPSESSPPAEEAKKETRATTRIYISELLRLDVSLHIVVSEVLAQPKPKPDKGKSETPVTDGKVPDDKGKSETPVTDGKVPKAKVPGMLVYGLKSSENVEGGTTRKNFLLNGKEGRRVYSYKKGNRILTRFSPCSLYLDISTPNEMKNCSDIRFLPYLLTKSVCGYLLSRLSGCVLNIELVGGRSFEVNGRTVDEGIFSYPIINGRISLLCKQIEILYNDKKQSIVDVLVQELKSHLFPSPRKELLFPMLHGTDCLHLPSLLSHVKNEAQRCQDCFQGDVDRNSFAYFVILHHIELISSFLCDRYFPQEDAPAVYVNSSSRIYQNWFKALQPLSQSKANVLSMALVCRAYSSSLWNPYFGDRRVLAREYLTPSLQLPNVFQISIAYLLEIRKKYCFGGLFEHTHVPQMHDIAQLNFDKVPLSAGIFANKMPASFRCESLERFSTRPPESDRKVVNVVALGRAVQRLGSELARFMVDTVTGGERKRVVYGGGEETRQLKFRIETLVRHPDQSQQRPGNTVPQTAVPSGDGPSAQGGDGGAATRSSSTKRGPSGSGAMLFGNPSDVGSSWRRKVNELFSLRRSKWKLRKSTGQVLRDKLWQRLQEIVSFHSNTDYGPFSNLADESYDACADPNNPMSDSCSFNRIEFDKEDSFRNEGWSSNIKLYSQVGDIILIPKTLPKQCEKGLDKLRNSHHKINNVLKCLASRGKWLSETAKQRDKTWLKTYKWWSRTYSNLQKPLGELTKKYAVWASKRAGSLQTRRSFVIKAMRALLRDEVGKGKREGENDHTESPLMPFTYESISMDSGRMTSLRKYSKGKSTTESQISSNIERRIYNYMRFNSISLWMKTRLSSAAGAFFCVSTQPHEIPSAVMAVPTVGLLETDERVVAWLKERNVPHSTALQEWQKEVYFNLDKEAKINRPEKKDQTPKGPIPGDLTHEMKRFESCLYKNTMVLISELLERLWDCKSPDRDSQSIYVFMHNMRVEVTFYKDGNGDSTYVLLSPEYFILDSKCAEMMLKEWTRATEGAGKSVKECDTLVKWLLTENRQGPPPIPESKDVLESTARFLEKYQPCYFIRLCLESYIARRQKGISKVSLPQFIWLTHDQFRDIVMPTWTVAPVVPATLVEPSNRDSPSTPVDSVPNHPPVPLEGGLV